MTGREREGSTLPEGGAAGEAGARQDFVTLAEALALLPLLPAADDWRGPPTCAFDIVGADGGWSRKARFALHTVELADGTRWRRWLIQNRLLMDGTTPEMIARGAIEGAPVEAVALLLHEKMDLERRLALVTAEMAATSANDEEAEIALLREALLAVMVERDALVAEVARLRAIGRREVLRPAPPADSSLVDR